MNNGSNALDRLMGAGAPAVGPLGQATAIEQSRAVAEVQAMVVVAQQRPRNIQAAVTEMRQSCDLETMAERAFYRYRRGTTNVSGPTVQLMRELARCFGNITYGIAELKRDDVAGVSEMQAFAWDLQTNTRSAQIFIVPHMRDKKSGPERLVDLRDIYESTANNGARRLREAIRSVLPPWFVEEAIERCNQTLRNGGGKPLPQRIADALKLFGGRGVTPGQIETKLGRKQADWNEHDVAQLVVVYKSIDRGEVTIQEEFPPERITAGEIKANAGRKSEETSQPTT
ncbi:hypothetical protein PV334_20150 [Streptomyces sp. ME02-7008A-1]|uniref:hypothetical protein n=1 Tax=Streptomyces TaxID=1883 RepID=UPI0029BD504D|nr:MULTISPECIES: hypothetical protein [unclassified Streptomyces]MDX3183562.1 hypothetical protein [Streptomyces sp. ME02-7008A-1]MDX3304014.1 hypothetical protein [Streptomyces sp. ME02-7008A]